MDTQATKMPARAIFFPQTSADVWTNRETGAMIRRELDGSGYRAFRPGIRTRRIGIAPVRRTRIEALNDAKQWVKTEGRGAIVRAHEEALAEAALRTAPASEAQPNLSGIKALDSICLRAGEGGHTLHFPARDETCRVPQVADEDSETVHYVADVSDDELSPCGVNVMRTPYTFGSPVWAEVDCTACLAKRPADAPPVHYGLSKERSGYTACGKHVEDVMFTFDDVRVTCPDCSAERAPLAVDDTVYVSRYGQTSAMIWKVVEVDVAGKRARVDLVRGSLLGPQWESWANLSPAKPEQVEPASEQGMTFTAAEVRIIRAVLAEASTAGLRAASVEPEAYDALWKRVKSGR